MGSLVKFAAFNCVYSNLLKFSQGPTDAVAKHHGSKFAPIPITTSTHPIAGLDGTPGLWLLPPPALRVS